MPKRFRRVEKIHKHIPTMLTVIDFPHTRYGGTWLKRGPLAEKEPGYAWKRLCFYAEKLRKLGMSDTDITLMFGDLYWDAFDEFLINDTYARARLSG